MFKITLQKKNELLSNDRLTNFEVNLLLLKQACYYIYAVE